MALMRVEAWWWGEPGTDPFGLEQVGDVVAAAASDEAHGHRGMIQPGGDPGDVDALAAGGAQDLLGADRVLEADLRHAVGEVQGRIRSDGVDHGAMIPTAARPGLRVSRGSLPNSRSVQVLRSGSKWPPAARKKGRIRVRR